MKAVKRMLRLMAIGLVSSFMILLLGSFSEIPAAPPSFPPFLVMASYESGAGTYPLGVGITNAIEKRLGIKARIIPTMTDAGKALLLRSKEAHYTLIGGGTAWFIAGGKIEFDSPEWGPQPLRILWGGGTVAIGFMTRASSGIKTITDLKGKRIAYMPGVHGPNNYNEAYLAFAGLTWDDVKKVSVSSYGASHKALKEKAVDATSSSVIAPGAKEMEASPHGIYWLPVPFENKEGWARLEKTAPYFFPDIATRGVGISKEKPLEVAYYGTFILSYSWLDNDLAYAITKAIDEGYDIYKNVHPQLIEWTFGGFLKYLPKAFMPLHPGAIKYLKEGGKWTPELEQWQSKQLAAETQRVKAWKEKYKLP